jgi:hypothetical protein
MIHNFHTTFSLPPFRIYDIRFLSNSLSMCLIFIGLVNSRISSNWFTSLSLSSMFSTLTIFFFPETTMCFPILRSSMALIWWGGWCYRSEGITVDAGVAWVSFLSVWLLGGRGGHYRCSGAAVEVLRVRRRCSGGWACWWRCLSIMLSPVCIL